jgi:hypothetical protein
MASFSGALVLGLILAAPKRAGALGASVHSRDRHVRSSVVLFRARGCLALQSKMLQLFHGSGKPLSYPRVNQILIVVALKGDNDGCAG